MIRTAKPQDINDIVTCAKLHLTEVGKAGYGTFDDNKLIQMVKDLMINPNVEIFVVEEDSQVKGYACAFVTESLWQHTKEGCLEYLYVMPEHRNGYNSKRLVQRCEEWFEKQNCDLWFASVTAFDTNCDRNQQFLDNADQLYSRILKPVGVIYAKGLDKWAV